MRMSKQEVREEMKESEGDPYIRARIRRLRRDLLRQQMMKQVPTATAVIVNPTHYAVALRYDHGSTAVPMVVAKGRNHLALRIREIAVSNGVPLVENPPLAQALYKSVKSRPGDPPAPLPRGRRGARLHLPPDEQAAGAAARSQEFPSPTAPTGETEPQA